MVDPVNESTAAKANGPVKRRGVSKGKIAAFVMSALLVVYLVLVFQHALLFIGTGAPAGVAIGVALIVFPIVGAWALYRELLFGFRTQKLVGLLRDDDLLPVDDLPKHPSGRPFRAAADADFETYRDEVEAAPESWQAWFRLGLAYDASGDRKRARKALRQAIALYEKA
ncbi:tetratricopeptide (TPR) repeat protein [Subtercola frigoramans]|uniref:Tetratricopeptide (TPR) repeat protein n=2 Tax=Subtercola frigoramans TaxID=120298 RepID=A0ABS2L4R7_9MICO|nr:tetratricopeptide (TPR) repeat protein [Subtercola frigoramans]